jgi:hypothetical protein
MSNVRQAMPFISLPTEHHASAIKILCKHTRRRTAGVLLAGALLFEGDSQRQRQLRVQVGVHPKLEAAARLALRGAQLIVTRSSGCDPPALVASARRQQHRMDTGVFGKVDQRHGGG